MMIGNGSDKDGKCVCSLIANNGTAVIISKCETAVENGVHVCHRVPIIFTSTQFT